MTEDAQRQLRHFQMETLERALVTFVEDVLGRVPTDKEIMELSYHVQFAASPIAVCEKDGHTFTRFYCWNHEHVLAYGFDPNAPLTLRVVRLRREEFPAALIAFIHQKKNSQ